MRNGRLSNQIAIVTGSDSGIGQATAIAFAREGADVAVTYFHDQEGARKTQKAVEEAGRKAVVVQLDVRQPESVAHLFDKVQDKLGIATILVNNAGTQNPGKPVKDMPFEDWDNQIKTDLYGPFFCCQQFIRRREDSDSRGERLCGRQGGPEKSHPGACFRAGGKEHQRKQHRPGHGVDADEPAGHR